MNVLGIETATDQVSVAIGDTHQIIGMIDVARGRRHAETLAPAIEWLCRATDVALSEIAVVAADVGPGGFTGMRVGLATASTLARAFGIPTVGVSSLDLVAFPLRHARRPIAALLQARKGEVYSALYLPVPGGLQRVSEPQVSSVADAIADLLAAPQVAGHEVLCAGDGAVRYADDLGRAGHLEVVDGSLARPSAGPLVQLAAALHERGQHPPLTPMYLRPPDAQINWTTRHGGAHRAADDHPTFSQGDGR